MVIKIMRIADTVQDSIVDGPGLRYVVFTQGCRHKCPGCHNPNTHDPDGGKEMPVSELISDMRRNPLTDGLTLTGGEPFLQAEGCAELARAAKEDGLTVWCYTGYTFEQLTEMAKDDPGVMSLLGEIDVLVDGLFLIDRRSLAIRWRGSYNQRVLDLKKSLAEGRPELLDGV